MEDKNQIATRPESEIRLFACAHCKGTGTCSTGDSGCSCNACAQAANAKRGSVGLFCGVCNGVGIAELRSDRLRRTIVPGLAIFIVALGFLVIVFAAVTNSPHFSEILAFCSGLIGVVIGYYFAGKHGTL
jgi:peptidoglycan/LPS O-acetylase OafA/YrhL